MYAAASRAGSTTLTHLAALIALCLALLPVGCHALRRHLRPDVRCSQQPLHHVDAMATTTSGRLTGELLDPRGHVVWQHRAQTSGGRQATAHAGMTAQSAGSYSVAAGNPARAC